MAKKESFWHAKHIAKKKGSYICPVDHLEGSHLLHDAFCLRSESLFPLQKGENLELNNACIMSSSPMFIR